MTSPPGNYGPPGQDPYGTNPYQPPPSQDPYGGSPFGGGPAGGYPPPPPPGGGFPSSGGGFPPPGQYPPADPYGAPMGGGFGAPVPPPRRSRKGLWWGLGAGVAVLALLCCGGIVLTYTNSEKGNEPEKKAAGNASASATASKGPSKRPTPTADSPSPSESANALDGVDQGDCLKNNGTQSDPDMVPATCAPGTYQVLSRFYGTTDTEKCKNVQGATTTYTVTYYRNNIPDTSRSYVFCLKQR